MTALAQVICDWIESLGWDDAQEVGWPLIPGPFLPDAPDRLVLITESTGPGYVLEGAADVSQFQARTRGAPNDPLSVETTARNLDALIFGASFPANVDGATIILVTRAGSGPVPLPYDPNDNRTEFTANYLITASGA